MKRESLAEIDRREFDAYCATMLAAFREHTGPGGNVWAHHTSALQKRNAGRDEFDVFAGAWHTVRPYVTQEFRQWIDEYDHEPRLTYSEFVAMRRYERERERSRERDYMESKEYCADRLRDYFEFDRDALICEMRARGATFAELRHVTGMARSTLAEIVARGDMKRRGETTPPAEIATAATTSRELVTLSDGTVIDLAEAF